MENRSQMTCRMYIDRKFFLELNEEGRSLYQDTEEGIYIELPVIQEEHINLGDCVLASVEAAYLEVNPKYEIKEDTTLKTELYKLGKTDEVFNVLATIRYAEAEEEFHEMLVFQQLGLTEEMFQFKLIGDQTMFNI